MESNQIKYDAIVVLGGGPCKDNGDPPEWTLRRCDLSVILQNESFGSCPIILLSGGTAHVPNKYVDICYDLVM